MNKTENLSNHVEKLIAKKLTNELVKEDSVTIFTANQVTALQGKKTFIKKDPNTDESIFKYADELGLLFIKNYKKFDPTVFKILNYIILLLTKQNKNKIKFKIKEYKKIAGLKTYNGAKRQLKNGINFLYNFNIKGRVIIFDGKRKKTIKLETRIIDTKIDIQHGGVIIFISNLFFEFLVNYGNKMLLPKIYFSLKSIPAETLFKLTTHDRINKFKKHGKFKKKIRNKNDYQIISVKKLLEAIGSITSYEEVKKNKDYHIEKRIINPLIKGLDELKNNKSLTWEFCNAKRKPLSKEQLEGIDKNGNLTWTQLKKDNFYLKWNNFKNLYIKYKLTFLNESIETKLIPEESSTLLENNP